MKLVLATHNSGKIFEFRQILADINSISVRSLLDYPTIPDILKIEELFLGTQLRRQLRYQNTQILLPLLMTPA